jgi:hypothetical protein
MPRLAWALCLFPAPVCTRVPTPPPPLPLRLPPSPSKDNCPDVYNDLQNDDVHPGGTPGDACEPDGEGHTQSVVVRLRE